MRAFNGVQDAVLFLAARWAKDRGAVLTTLLNNTTITTATPIDAPAPRKKYGWLPLLTVLFCLSYALMTMLIVEQGATIQSQRNLIRELFRDSTELSGFKQRAIQEKARAGGHAVPSPKPHAPSAQVPSPQAPTQHAPSSQGGQQQAQKQKPRSGAPSRPAADFGDRRRLLIAI